jgi:hypothetical protein
MDACGPVHSFLLENQVEPYAHSCCGTPARSKSFPAPPLVSQKVSGIRTTAPGRVSGRRHLGVGFKIGLGGAILAIIMTTDLSPAETDGAFLPGNPRVMQSYAHFRRISDVMLHACGAHRPCIRIFF